MDNLQTNEVLKLIQEISENLLLVEHSAKMRELFKDVNIIPIEGAVEGFKPKDIDETLMHFIHLRLPESLKNQLYPLSNIFEIMGFDMDAEDVKTYVNDNGGII